MATDRGTATTLQPEAHTATVWSKSPGADAPPPPTVPTVGQIWPRGNQIQR